MDPLRDLGSIVGSDCVRSAEPADAIDGVHPDVVVRPGTIDEVSRVLAAAARRRWTVAPRGGGTKMGIGGVPDPIDVVLDLTRMDRVLEHAAGDLVLSVEAGARMAALGPELAGAGQMLALDPPEYGATVGGVVATNAAGPRRFRYGAVRDLLIGVTLVLADGTVARAGGKVVKNVAGYDLGKLVTGSLGTLAVIVGAVFRLHPRPPARRLVLASASTPAQVEAAVQRILHSPLVPTAILLEWPAGVAPRLGVLFEGEEPSVDAQSADAARRLQLGDVSVVAPPREVRDRWAALAPPKAPPGGLVLKITCLPARLAETIDTIRTAAGSLGPAWRLGGFPGLGLLDLRFDAAEPAAAATLVRHLRARIDPGHVVVVAAPPEIKHAVDVWGPVGDGLDLMRRLKLRFDPDRRLNPARFVGGI